jgi:hypothetical protein
MRFQSIPSLFVRYWHLAPFLVALSACGGGGSVEIVSASVEPIPLRPSSKFTVKVQIRGDRCLSTRVYLKRAGASEQFDELELRIMKSHSTSCGEDSFEGECGIEAATPGSTERHIYCGVGGYEYRTEYSRQESLFRPVGPLVFRVISTSSVADFDVFKKMMAKLGIYDVDDEVASFDIPAALE